MQLESHNDITSPGGLTVNYPKCTTIAILEDAVNDLGCLNRMWIRSKVGCDGLSPLLT